MHPNTASCLPMEVIPISSRHFLSSTGNPAPDISDPTKQHIKMHATVHVGFLNTTLNHSRLKTTWREKAIKISTLLASLVIWFEKMFCCKPYILSSISLTDWLIA